MKFLADENLARRIVQWLRSRGDDVLYAPEERTGEPEERTGEPEERTGEIDAEWLRRAESEGRLVVTSDKDFGDLIFRDGLTSYGVVLLRLAPLSLDARLKRLEQTWSVVEANPSGSFIVITPQRVRVRPLSS